ncbi:hypothetical protein BV210_14995 [Halorientalis sp. IM1011]|uniref:DUF5796 family protein n=1 Tax=Halorientalis sp. IM1011 TaxID=1932360 RepID=UPI00097CCA9D|nr:DUF5796 family protein [Halorientalis sp. IM1011]AQL43927.1 hypothetical protein BV210_14995 [Halorientalis sp. IM1011]
MSSREEVSPQTLPIELTEDGITVEYADGREAFYRGVPQKRESPLRTAPGRDVHVLVTDGSEQQGVLTYVNDLKTHADILQDTGVGRVMLDKDEQTTVFPGVAVRNEAHRVVVEADLDRADGRVFVFEENQMGERAFEIVADA